MPQDDNHDLPTTPDTSRANLPDHARRMQDLLGGLSNIATTIAESGGVASQFPFIGINNDGVWAFGQDRTEVEAGSLWAVDVRSWKHGYIAWPPNTAKERKPLGERMVSAGERLPDVHALPDVGQPYQIQFSFELLCVSGVDKGTIALYKNGSYGAKVAVQALVDEVRKQARLDPSRLCPVVELLIRDYFHKEWKKTIYNPILGIKKWISADEYDAFDKKASEAAPEAIVDAPPPSEPDPESPRGAPAAAHGTGRKLPPETPQPTVASGAGRRRPSSRTQPGA
jgi:hypothetical protein